MLDKFAPFPEEGERNREDLVEMLFNYAAKISLLGSWSDFKFDAWSSLCGEPRVTWYIGDASDPDYGSCRDRLYISEKGFEEGLCCEWIDAFHTFLLRHEAGLNIDGNKPCIQCDGFNIMFDEDCNAPWCLDCEDWAHLNGSSKHEPREDYDPDIHMTEYDAKHEYNSDEKIS